MTKRIFKTHEKRGLVLSIAAASLALGLAGCGAGSGSDPTADYKDLNANVAPHTEKARTQGVLDRVYSIEPSEVAFTEGESGTFKLRVNMFFPVESYDLKLTGVTKGVEGISMVRDASEPGTFLVSWAVPKGVIPTNEGQMFVKYRVELTDVKSKDPAVEKIFATVKKDKEFSFAVFRTSKAPEIVGKNSIPSEVAQGSMPSFSVDVMDPASYDGFAPRLDIYFRGTNKNAGIYEANGASYVRVDSTPKRLENGAWRFSFFFDAKNNDVGAQLDGSDKRVDGATHLMTRMYMRAYSAAGIASSETSAMVKIRYKEAQIANPPEMVPKSELLKVISEKEAKVAAAAAAKAEKEAKVAAAKAEKEAKAATAKAEKEAKAAAAKADKEAKAAAKTEKVATAKAEKASKKSTKATAATKAKADGAAEQKTEATTITVPDASATSTTPATETPAATSAKN